MKCCVLGKYHFGELGRGELVGMFRYLLNCSNTVENVSKVPSENSHASSKVGVPLSTNNITIQQNTGAHLHMFSISEYS